MQPHNGRHHHDWEAWGNERREMARTRGTHDPWRWDMSLKPPRSTASDGDYLEREQYGHQYGGRYGARSPEAEERYVNLGETSMRYGDRGLGGEPHGGYNYHYEQEHAHGMPRSELVGKGPKGYVRTDERIREDICERLAAGYMDASDVDVLVKDGEVTLSGTVNARRYRRMAEELIDNVSGIKDIENKLKVKEPATIKGDDDVIKHGTW